MRPESRPCAPRCRLAHRWREPARSTTLTGANHGAASAGAPSVSCQPPALGRLAGPRPRLADDPRPRLHGIQNRDLALLPSAVAPHPQVPGSQSSSSSSSKSRDSINMSVPGTRCREGTGPLPAQYYIRYRIVYRILSKCYIVN